MVDRNRQAGSDLRAEDQNGEARISLPLYAAGLVVTICGILAVTASLAPGDSTSIQTTCLLLTILGFGFSLACRYLHVRSRFTEIGFLLFAAFIAYELLSQRISAAWFLGGADQQDMKLAMLLVWASVLRSWTLLSDDLVLFSCVLSAAMFGLMGTQDISTTMVTGFYGFVLAMLFLLIHQNFLQNRLLAAPGERDRAWTLILPVQMVITTVCALAVLVLGAGLVAPARMVFSNISLAQAIRGLVNSKHSQDGDLSAESQRFSDDPSLEIGLGSVWPTTSNVLLHVSPSDLQPHYWRGRTYDLYRGTGWQSTQDILIPIQTRASDTGKVYTIATPKILGEGIETAHSRARLQFETTFDVRGETDEFYYADEPHTILFDGNPGVEPRSYKDGRIDLDGHLIHSAYTVTSTPPPDPSFPQVQIRLQNAGADYPPMIVQRYLGPLLDVQNSVTTDDDIRSVKVILAQIVSGLPPDRRTPFDKAMAIRDWVASHCIYSLSVDATPPEVDHVRYFLTESRRGYCDLFASAVVVLCRLEHIPARMATGFAPGDRDATGFNLRAMDKHAWAEVYFPGVGWQIFDATVGTQTDGSVPTLRGSSAGLWLRLRRLLDSAGPVPDILLMAIVLFGAYLVKIELFDRWRTARQGRTARKVPVQEMEQNYAQMTRALSRLGLPRRVWETPAEFEARAVPFLIAQEAALGVPLHPGVVSAISARFAAVRYGGETPDTLDTLHSDLRDFARAAVRAQRIHLWRRIRRGPVSGKGE